MNNVIEKEIIDILKKYAKSIETVDINTKIEELGIDSLKMIQSIVDFENLFTIDFEVEKLNKDEFIYVMDLVDYIRLRQRVGV